MSEFARISAISAFAAPGPVEAGASRRSLAASGSDPAAPPAFRRFDLSRTPPPPRPVGAEDRHSQQDSRARGRPVADRPDRPGDEPGRAGARAESAGIAAGRDDLARQPFSPGVSDGGVPMPPAAGRTSLLSGSMGVMAQLFGQDFRGFGGAGPRGGVWRQDAADDAWSRQDDEPPRASSLMTRLGIGAYEAVNRIIGAATERMAGGDGVDYLFAMPNDWQALDEVA